jgi:GT2 family glycosyltransferase
MKTAAVVTVTTGGKTLEKCLSSVANQSYSCNHYVLCDGDDDSSLAQFYDMTKDYAEFGAKWSYWGNTIGGNGWLGQRWLAAAPQLIKEDVTFFCNDDDWYDQHHVSSIMKKIEEGYDWAHSLRKVYDQEGKYLFDDNCEAIGENPPRLES